LVSLGFDYRGRDLRVSADLAYQDYKLTARSPA
jgi:hypothetical protein